MAEPALVDVHCRFTPANFVPLLPLLLARGVHPPLAAVIARAIEQRLAPADASDAIAFGGDVPLHSPTIEELLAESALATHRDRLKRLDKPTKALLAALLDIASSERTLANWHHGDFAGGDVVTLQVASDEEFVAGAPGDIGHGEQITRIADLARWSDGAVLGLVPFDARRPACIAVVREGLARGCVGVAIEEPPGARRNQRGADAATHELLRLCATDGIPIFASCSAAPTSLITTSAASRLQGWSKVLARRAYRDLRLCLGGVAPAAMSRALSMAAKAGPNVVVDVGQLSAADLKRLLAKSPALAKRMVFGSGFPFVETKKALGRIERIRADRALAAHADAILVANALRWLGRERPAPAALPRGARAAAAPSASLGGDAAHALDCIVIGAGIAGLTAARNIAAGRWDRPPRSVLVVEAGDRLGGRMHTLRRLSIPVELGAELIHRPSTDQFTGGFSLWDEIARYGFRTRKIKKMSANQLYFKEWRSSGAALRSGCGICNDPDVKLGMSVLDSAASWHSGTDLSGTELIEQALAEAEDETDNARAMADYLLTGTVPGPTDRISVAGLASDKVKDQQFSMEEYHVVEGYDAVPALIGAGLDVELNARVNRIEWWYSPPSAGVRVHVDDGRVFHARTGVCTLPIGVMKNSVVFDPPLPAAKQAALARIEMGRLSKIALVFGRRFWPTLLSLLSNPGAARRGGRSYFVPSFEVDDAPPILNALITREDAEVLDAAVAPHARRSRNDGLDPAPVEDYIAQRILPDLNDLFPAAQIGPADVADWHCRSWANDPLALGGTAYLVHEPGTPSWTMHEVRATLADHRDTLPLYWAGEAMAQGTNPWSVHGAHQSGIVAARNVRAYLALPVSQ